MVGGGGEGGGAMGRCRRRIVLGLVSHYKWHPSTRIATLPRIFPGAVLKLDFNGAHPVLILDLPRLRAAVPGALISPFIYHLEASWRVCVCACVSDACCHSSKWRVTQFSTDVLTESRLRSSWPSWGWVTFWWVWRRASSSDLLYFSPLIAPHHLI